MNFDSDNVQFIEKTSDYAIHTVKKNFALRSIHSNFKAPFINKLSNVRSPNIISSNQTHAASLITKRYLRSTNDREKEIPKPTHDNPPVPVAPSNSRLGTIASVALGTSILFGKTKYLLVALKLTKATPLISMLITSAAYSFIFGWPYAIGMVGLIFFHECGHAIVMYRYGVPFSPMVFIPFMGAVIAQKEHSRDAYEEAMIAFGGPVAGTIAAVMCGTIGILSGSQLLIALADFGYMINLFNLLPIGSMDGGRIGGAISPWFNIVGLAIGGGMLYTGLIHNPIFSLMMLGGTYSAMSRMFGWEESDGRDKQYYKIGILKQLRILMGYIALITFLLYIMNYNNKYRKHPKQLNAPNGKLKEGQTWSDELLNGSGKDDNIDFYNESNTTVDDFIKRYSGEEDV